MAPDATSGISDRQNTMLRELVEEMGLALAREFDMPTLVRGVARRLRVAVGARDCDIYVVEDDGAIHCLASIGPEGEETEFSGRLLDLTPYPLTRRAVETGEPFIVTDPEDERLSDGERAVLRKFGYTCELCTPLVVDGRVLGLIDLFGDGLGSSAAVPEFVRIVGQLMAGGLANIRLLDRLKGANRDLMLLASAGLDFGASLDLDEVLGSISLSMCRATGATWCDIYALEGDHIRCLVCVGEDGADTQFRGTVYSPEELGTVREVLATREPVAVYDVESDDRWSQALRDEWGKFGLRSGLNLPLLNRSEVIGVLCLFDERPREFESLDVLRGLAQVAAQAMANAELYRRLQLRTREAELLNEIARRTAASLDVGQIATEALTGLTAITPFDQAAFVLGAPDEPPRAIYVWRDGEVAELPRGRMRAAPFARLVERERVVVLDLTKDQPQGVPQAFYLGMGAAAVIGLALNDKTIGCLVLSSVRPGAFDQVDRDVLGRVGMQLTLAINNARLYEDIKRMHLSNLKALSSALTAKDYYTLGHAARVSAYIMLLGAELGWARDVTGQVEEAAYLHDIGKIGISDRVLLKPSSLNAPEWEVMRHHPVLSADIIRPLFPDELVLGVRHHHERWDGRGYPDGLEGDAIPVLARAMCVVDSYDAMSFRRPYRGARTFPECLGELKACSGSQFDPEIVEAFTGVLWKLADRRVAAIAVAEQAAARLDLAKHALLRCPRDETRPEYREIAAMLRELRDANPAIRYLETYGQIDGKFVMVVDPDEDPTLHTPIGDQIIADQELPEAFAGVRLDSNTLMVDHLGVWVSGRVPVVGLSGGVAAVVAAVLPPAPDLDLAGMHSDVAETFAGAIRRTAALVGKADLEAITDGLTGLYSHRYVHERLGEEIERARADGGSVTLLLCALDDFRTFNAEHGYDEGDRALRAVALVVEECLRSVDLAGRYGGDEFAAILIGTDAKGAAEVADRLRRAVAGTGVTASGRRLTASIGFATFPEDANGREELADKAEWARQRAKRAGRDTVVGFGAWRRVGAATRPAD